jgi:2-polyprenyl-6-methoxyphenol hydroxylase-like FAD-dependent oxidoreductase
MKEGARALILAQALAAAEEGDNPEAIARRYPALRDEILALLHVTAALKDEASAPDPDPAFLRSLGERLRQTNAEA